MNEIQETNEAAQPGKYLRYEREKRGISVEEIAHQLCLPLATIANLESGANDELPESIYVRGYIRAYCQFLNIDPAPVLKLEAVRPGREGATFEDFMPTTLVNERVQHLTRIWGSVAVAAVAVFLIASWWIENMLPPADIAMEPIGISSTVKKVADGVVDESPGAAQLMEDIERPEFAVTETEDEAGVVEKPTEESVTEDRRTWAPSWQQGAADDDVAGNAQTVENAPIAGPESATVEATAQAFAPSAVVAEPGRQVAMRIIANARSWTRISDGSGENIVHRILPINYNKYFTVVLPLHFELGNVRGVRVWLDGEEYDLAPHIGRHNTAFFSVEGLPGSE